MSSREIAELCDKRHDNVMADIRKMLDELDIYAPEKSGAFITGNQQYREYLLTKEQCIDLTLSMANFHSPKLGSATLLRFLKI